MILDAMLWGPRKALKCGMQRLLGTDESPDDMARSANQAIADYIKEFPL